MADESLNAFISVGTDAPEAAAKLAELPTTVGSVVTQVNTELSRLSQQNPFARIMSDAERSSLTIKEVAQAASAAAAAVRLLNEANAQGAGITRVLDPGSGTKVSIGEIQAQNDALQRQFSINQELLKQEAQLRELRALPPGQRGGSLPFTGGTQPGTAFISDAEREENKRAEQLAAARNSLLGASRSTKPIEEDLAPLTRVPIDVRQDIGAITQAMSEGLVAFEGKSILAVREAFAGINGAIEPGFYNARTGQPLGAMDELYHGGKSKFMNAGGGGGDGGFFGGLAGGFKGGDDEFSLGSLGEQAGFIGRWVLIYQVFRDIEEAIKASVEQSLEFDRSVTDLANRLQVSRQEAHGLATEIGLIGAPAGLGPAATVGEAATFAGAFAGAAPTGDLAKQGAIYAAQLQVLTGTVKESMPQAIAATRAFNLGFDETERVLDAATSAAQNFGLANAQAVLPGLATIGDLAKAAGFSVEETANLLADLQTRTGDSSEAIAGQLQRFFGREGQPAFQTVFSSLGINTNQSFKDELAQLSEQYEGLSQSQKDFIVSEFGGGRAGVAAAAFIEDYKRVIDAASKSLDEGGIAQKQYQARLDDIVGALHSVKGELLELAKDVGTSGLGAGFGIAIEAAKPFVELLDEAVRLLNEITSAGGHFTFGRDLILGAAELYGAAALLSRLGVGARIGGIFGRRGAAGTAAEETPEGVAANATTAALDRLAVAADRAAAGLTADAEASTVDAEATGADTAAKERDVVATTEDSAAKTRGAILGATGLGLGAGVSGAGLLGALSSPAGIIGGLLVAQQFYDAEKRIGPAIRAAQTGAATAFDSPTDADSLQARAQKLRQQAQQAESASSGVFGSIENYVGAAEGRLADLVPGRATLARIPVYGRLFNVNDQTTGEVASENRALANFASELAKRSDAAQATAFRSGDYADQIDLTKQGGVDASLKNLAGLGLDAGQQLDALNEKLRTFALAAQGSATFLAHGGAVLASQNFANAASTTLERLVRTTGDPNDVEKRLGSKGFIQNLAPGLNDAINNAALDFLTPLEGTNISSDQERELSQKTQRAMVDFLRRNGFSPEDIKKVLPDLHAAAGSAVQEQIAQLNGARGLPISQEAIGQIVKDLPQLISGTTEEVTNRAALGDIASGGDGTQLTGLQAALRKAQTTYRNLVAGGATKTDPDSLRQAKDILNGLRVQVQTAVLANMDAQEQLLEASIPPENELARINAALANTQRELDATRNPDDRRRLRALRAQERQQQAQARDANAISGIGLDTNPADAVAEARDAAEVAHEQVRRFEARGVHGSALNNAKKQARQADYAYAQAQLQDANDARDGAVAVGDIVGEAYASWQDALAVANAEVGGARAKGLRDAQEKYYEYLRSRAELANARRDANVRSGDPLEAAHAQLRDAERNLDADIKGTDQYYKDLRSVHEAEAALATQIAQGAQQSDLLRGDTTDPVEQARATLHQARTQLAQDRRRHTGNIGADRLGVENASEALQRARFDQQMSDQQNVYDLGRESAGQYLQFLENQSTTLRLQLHGMKKGSEGYRQLLDELNTVDQAIYGLNQSAVGQFNIGDNIKAPTLYEVRRSIAQGSQSVVDASTTNNNVTMNGVDIAQVLAYINSILGPSATGARSASANRKVA